jgi:thiol-disulfide isomerase/thioredoxin
MRIFATAGLLALLPSVAVYAHSNSMIKSVGNPLAKELQDKPALLMVKSRNCPMCRQMAPTVQQLKEKYKGKVTFITFDVSDSKSANDAAKVAETANLSAFFAKHRNNTGLILAVDPRTGNVIEQFGHTTTIDNFTKVLDSAIVSFAQK